MELDRVVEPRVAGWTRCSRRYGRYYHLPHNTIHNIYHSLGDGPSSTVYSKLIYDQCTVYQTLLFRTKPRTNPNSLQFWQGLTVGPCQNWKEFGFVLGSDLNNKVWYTDHTVGLYMRTRDIFLTCMTGSFAQGNLPCLASCLIIAIVINQA